MKQDARTLNVDNAEFSKATLQGARDKNLDQLTDNELLRLFVIQQSGDAMNEFVFRHKNKVMAVCRTVSVCGSDADDAFQATFLAAVKNARRLINVTSHGGWLCRVAFNASLKAKKLKFRQKNSGGQIAVVELTPDPVPETWQIIENREAMDTLVKELLRLPKNYQDCLVLYYFDGLSRSETAARMGKSVSAVKALLQRGKKLLKSRLLGRGVGPAIAVTGIGLTSKWATASSSDALMASTLQNCQAVLEPARGVIPETIQKLSESTNSHVSINLVAAKSMIAMTCILSACMIAFLPATVSSPAVKRDPIELVASQAAGYDIHTPELVENGELESVPGETAALDHNANLIRQEIAADQARIEQLVDWSQHKRAYAKASTVKGEAEMLLGFVNEMELESAVIELKLKKKRQRLSDLVNKLNDS